MLILSPGTRDLIQDFVARALETRLGYLDCVGRAAVVLRAVEPAMTTADAWDIAEELVRETLGGRAESDAEPLTYH